MTFVTECTLINKTNEKRTRHNFMSYVVILCYFLRDQCHEVSCEAAHPDWVYEYDLLNSNGCYTFALWNSRYLFRILKHPTVNKS